MAGHAPSKRNTRSAGRLVARAIEGQIGSAELPSALRVAVRAQFKPSRRRPTGSCSLFGLLTMYAFESAGGGPIASAAPAAAAVEFAAAAGSVLDDLQDSDPIPGIDCTTPGAGAELVALLLLLSHRSLAAGDREHTTADGVLAAYELCARCELMALGAQHASIGQNYEAGVTLEEAVQTSCGKSGSFGRLAAEVGATLATADPSCITRHGDFGWHAVVVDQMQNDIAGVWPGGEASTDLRLGRLTPPIAFALQVPVGTSAAADGVKSALRGAVHDRPDEASVREAVFRSGGVHFAYIQAALHRARAMRIARDEVRFNPSSQLADLLLV